MGEISSYCPRISHAWVSGPDNFSNHGNRIISFDNKSHGGPGGDIVNQPFFDRLADLNGVITVENYFRVNVFFRVIIQGSVANNSKPLILAGVMGNYHFPSCKQKL